MTALEPTAHANAAASRVARLIVRVADLVRAIAKSRMNRRHAMELAELSDHQLADIGLTRDDLASVRQLPLGQDPTASLADIVRRRGVDDDFVRLHA
jgi:uncharacterized protein YjiS (DUF1127 family)